MFWLCVATKIPSGTSNLPKTGLRSRVEYNCRRIHYSVNLGIIGAIFCTYKNRESPANKKPPSTGGFDVGASNRNRTL